MSGLCSKGRPILQPSFYSGSNNLSSAQFMPTARRALHSCIAVFTIKVPSLRYLLFRNPSLRSPVSPFRLIHNPLRICDKVELVTYLVRVPLSRKGMDLGQKLQFYRRIRRMSLRDVAEKAECSPSFLSQIELDRVSPP